MRPLFFPKYAFPQPLCPASCCRAPTSYFLLCMLYYNPVHRIYVQLSRVTLHSPSLCILHQADNPSMASCIIIAYILHRSIFPVSCPNLKGTRRASVRKKSTALHSVGVRLTSWPTFPAYVFSNQIRLFVCPTRLLRNAVQRRGREKKHMK